MERTHSREAAGCLQEVAYTSRTLDWSRVRMEKPEDSLLLEATMQ